MLTSATSSRVNSPRKMKKVVCTAPTSSLEMAATFGSSPWMASQAGWVVAEVGRQPWAIQGLLPNVAAISRLDVGAVQTTFFIFLVLFTLLLVAEVSIMVKAIAAGPENE